jgi:hypothetical protein
MGNTWCVSWKKEALTRDSGLFFLASDFFRQSFKFGNSQKTRNLSDWSLFST